MAIDKRMERDSKIKNSHLQTHFHCEKLIQSDYNNNHYNSIKYEY